MDLDRVYSLVQRQSRALGGVLLFVGVLCARHWVVAPHLTALHASQQYESATDERIKKSTVVNHELRAKQIRLDKLMAQYALLSDMAFGPAQADEFLGDLEAFCRQSGCDVASLRFLSHEDQANRDGGLPLVSQGAALTVHGTYAGITRLIERLQGRREKVWIDKLRVAAYGPDPTRVVCHLTMTIYVNLDEENAGHEHGPILN